MVFTYPSSIVSSSTCKRAESALERILENKFLSIHSTTLSRQEKPRHIHTNHDVSIIPIPLAVPKPKVDTTEYEDVRKKIIELSKKGLGPVAISRLLGISRQRASRWIRRYEEDQNINSYKVNKKYSENHLSPDRIIQLPLPHIPSDKKVDNEIKTEDKNVLRLDQYEVEELQCIDEDSIEALTSIYYSDESESSESPATMDVITNEDNVRDQIVTLHKEGLGPTAIARELGITRQRASRWVKRFISEGSILTKHRMGRPKKLTPDQKYQIRKYAEETPGASISDIISKFGLSCSRSTVRTVVKANESEE